MRSFFLLLVVFFMNITYAMGADHESDLPRAPAGDYVLGAGDVIRVDVYGSKDLNLEARVSQSGTISYPLLGELKVAGLTPAEAEKMIAKGLKVGGYIKQPHVNLVVMQYQSQFVAVLGDVYKPGRFSLDRTSTLSDALAMAGGVTQNGSDFIVLNRKEAGTTVKYKYDIRDMLEKGDDKSNPKVLAGDIVYVPKAPVFYIYGEVQRPGSFKLQRDMTVAQALSMGGGLTPRGTERGIQIKRADKSGKLDTIDVELGDYLVENDVVIISESWF